ncbi:cell division cycle-associated protein 7-like isoform X1 [Scleropages formosus]|uniref:cell division cycle-associated protein 7-like isoform X1 n=1 Tax=Scleropages formosus TaxID=113540 RepID=UPI0010FAC50D|nr:cell division cycle-associated protein 7-like isoform X1 [Scleropages formosus]
MEKKGLSSLAKDLEEIFAESSENEQTFYGFSDCGTSDAQSSEGESEDSSRATSTQKSSRHFHLRVALRTRPLDETRRASETEGEEEEPRARLLPPSSSDSENEQRETFLEKRASTIKANKAMLAQLMADLHKLPGVLKTSQTSMQKVPRSRAVRNSLAACEVRRNPERASRRRTRSTGLAESSSVAHEEKELELSLEQELLQVRGVPRLRGNPRPNQSKPHTVRPVENITEDELNLVADGVTDKVYNSMTGSTCHQCRQKTTDTKTCCRNLDCHGIRGQFCGPCLRNRYGEDVRTALLDPDWWCPPCRGICNCSFCRQRDGCCPTGILFPLARYHGFSDVHSYLNSLRQKLKNEEDTQA